MLPAVVILATTERIAVNSVLFTATVQTQRVVMRSMVVTPRVFASQEVTLQRASTFARATPRAQ